MEFNQIQIHLNPWIEAFTNYSFERNIDLDIYEFIYPSNEWDHEEWYLLQLNFEKHCGIKKDWWNDCGEDNLYGYIIIDKKKFAWAKLKYQL